MTPTKKDADRKADQDKTVKPGTPAAKKAESAAKEGRATEERESEQPKKGASMPKDATKHAAPGANKSNEPNKKR